MMGYYALTVHCHTRHAVRNVYTCPYRNLGRFAFPSEASVGKPDHAHHRHALVCNDPYIRYTFIGNRREDRIEPV